MITPKQNVLETIHGGSPEYVPLTFEAIHIGGFFAGLDQPGQPGNDAFGVPWQVTKEGAIPQPGYVLFDDITQWKKHVVFPDLDAMDFRAMAAAERDAFPQPDRNQKLFSLITACGPFERLVAFMGFENALCALMLEPDECMNFFEAVSDYKVALTGKLIDAYNPDVFIMCDDIATARGLFMSPETYRRMIKPFHKRIVESATSRDVIFEMHCCGKCEEVIPDFIEIGAKMWHSAQTVNDISGILDKYAGQITVEGGWDSSGPVSYMGADDEMIREEVRRCLREYKKPGFILMPTMMNENGNSLFVGDDRLVALEDEWNKLRMF